MLQEGRPVHRTEQLTGKYSAPLLIDAQADRTCGKRRRVNKSAATVLCCFGFNETLPVRRKQMPNVAGHWQDDRARQVNDDYVNPIARSESKNTGVKPISSSLNLSREACNASQN